MARIPIAVDLSNSNYTVPSGKYAIVSVRRMSITGSVSIRGGSIGGTQDRYFPVVLTAGQAVVASGEGSCRVDGFEFDVPA